MKKVAIVYHYLALYRLPIFSELMQSDKIEFTLFSGLSSEITIKKIDENLSDLSIEKGGLRWVFLKNIWFFKKKFLWQSGLLQVALKSDYDSFIFLGSPYFISTWLAVMIVRLRGKYAYFWMHGVYKDKPSKVDWLKLKLFYPLATGFFLYGNRGLSILKKYQIKPDSQMHVIYNSLDYKGSLKFRRFVNVSDINDFRFSNFGSHNLPTIIFIGRLNSVKRMDMLINAQFMLKQKMGHIPFNILVIGDGDQRLKLEQLSMKLGLDEGIKFLGAVYDEETIANSLLYADLCVIPGEVGLTAMHAMSYGVPVISHDNFNVQMPEVEAIQKGFTGDLFHYGNVESLSEIIFEWFSRYPIKNKEVMKACFSVIDSHYNPSYQRSVFETVFKES